MTVIVPSTPIYPKLLVIRRSVEVYEQTYILVADNCFSNSLSLIMRRSERFERLQCEEAAINIERHARRFEVRFSGADVVKHARKSPGAGTKDSRVLGEELLCDDLSCK